MQIKKLGHCCMLIEVDGLKILTDPGDWSDMKATKEKDIDLILITHEHGDHLHMDSLKEVLKNNPKAKVITNTSVGKLLSENGLIFDLLENKESNSFNGLQIEGFGEKHDFVYDRMPDVQNVGYFIGGKFFYPGDALTNPKKPIEILALPVAGPWLSTPNAIDYAKELKPRVAFPVHDGMLKHYSGYHGMPNAVLTNFGIDFKDHKENEELIVEI